MPKNVQASVHNEACFLRDGPLRTATLRPASVLTPRPASPQGPLRVTCNPCLGIPLIVIETPLRHFGIQMLAGLASVLVVLLCGEWP